VSSSFSTSLNSQVVHGDVSPSRGGVAAVAGNGRQNMKTTANGARTAVQVTTESTFLLHPEDNPSLKPSPDTGNPKFVVVFFFPVVFLCHPMQEAIHQSTIHKQHSSKLL